jgi:predicted O-methyltransferase YrrM
MAAASAPPPPPPPPPLPLAKVVLLTRDEHDLIDDFLDYYSGLFGAANVHVVDNGSVDRRVLAAYARHARAGGSVCVDARPFTEAGAIMTQHMRRLAGACTFLLPLETDEFLFRFDKAADSAYATRADDVRDALLAIPADVSVVRYAGLFGSRVAYDDGDDGDAEATRGVTAPARQLTAFADQRWDKLIVRAAAFDRMTQWSHHAAVTSGGTAVCAQLALLHFHDTGAARRFERATRITAAYGYIDAALDPADPRNIASARHAFHRRVANGHRAEQYFRLAERVQIGRRFAAAAGRPPAGRAEFEAAVRAYAASGDTSDAAVRAAIAHAAVDAAKAAQAVPVALKRLVFGGAAVAPPPGPEDDTTVVEVAHVARALRPALAALVDPALCDKGSTHTYLDVYDALLQPAHRRAARVVLEVGVFKGGSVAMWRRYFDAALVVGVDVDLSLAAAAGVVDCTGADPRVALVAADAYAPATVAAVRERFGPLDVVIDDGPHTLASMLFFVEHYGRALAPGGVLVIENVPRIEWTSSILAAVPADLRPFARVLDRRALKGQFDDILVVIDLANPAPATSPLDLALDLGRGLGASAARDTLGRLL